MTAAIRYALARPQDLAAVQRLLSANDLPHEDIGSHLERCLLAWSGDRLVGSVGLEICGEPALLRSLCVDSRFRSQGVARELCRRIESFARLAGCTRLYLLTTTAERFFARRGYQVVGRASAPAPIQATLEFGSACPATARCMTRAVPNGALYLTRELLPLRPDVPGASQWAVSLDLAMLSYFEVEPQTRFPPHAHEGEQITTVVEGELYFELDGEVHCLQPGEVIAIPPGVVHAVYTKGRRARAFDAWAPPPPRYRGVGPKDS
jgi:amino-acid N-acetyltransferase